MMEDEGSPPPIKREKSASEIRKSNKPLMEKRRRERINNCLEQLKSILMEVTKKESSYYSKLEKADILEMTVKYLKNLKRQQLAVAMTNDPTVLTKYIAGFNECTTEVTKYLSTVDGLNTENRTHLLNHLANSLQRSSVTMATNTATANLQMAVNQACVAQQQQQQQQQQLGIQVPTATQVSALPGNNGGLCVLSPGGASTAPAPLQTLSASPMQLVPVKLASGEVVFLLANNQGMLGGNSQGGAVCGSSVSTLLPSLGSASSLSNMNQLQEPVSTSGSTTLSPELSLTGLSGHSSSYVFPASLASSIPMEQKPIRMRTPEPNNNRMPSPDSAQPSTSAVIRRPQSCDMRISFSDNDVTSGPQSPGGSDIAINYSTKTYDDTDSDDDVSDEDSINNNGAHVQEDGSMWRPW